MSWVEELDTLPNNFGLQRFRLLMEPTNLLPKHIPTFQQMLHMLSI